jgi:hypothetical protein
LDTAKKWHIALRPLFLIIADFETQFLWRHAARRGRELAGGIPKPNEANVFADEGAAKLSFQQLPGIPAIEAPQQPFGKFSVEHIAA